MNDQPVGLLARAKRLANLARQTREGAEAIQDHTRTETALSKLDTHLSDLETAIKLESKLVSAGVKPPCELDLAKPPRELKQHIASVGRPSPQLLTARASDVAKAVKVFSDAAGQEWARWSKGKLSALPVDRLARLGFERPAIESRLETLKRAAAERPSIESVDRFVESYRSVAARLEKVESLGPVDELLNKLPCYLDELTDEELRLLRVDYPDIGAQILLEVE